MCTGGAEQVTDPDQQATALAVAAMIAPPSKARELAVRSSGLGS